MEQSILTSTKMILGVEDYDAFDHDITTHINSAFGTLAQLGIGPSGGFMIDDAGTETWAEFIDLETEQEYSPIKTYIYLKVRMLFDPPTTSYAVSAMQDQIREQEWRLSTLREGYEWTPPEEEVVFVDE